jgi:hypothetical protein
MRWAGHVVCTGPRYRVLMGKPEGKLPLTRTRSRWEDNIKMDIQEVGWENELDKYSSEQVLLVAFCECGN